MRLSRLAILGLTLLTACAKAKFAQPSSANTQVFSSSAPVDSGSGTVNPTPSADPTPAPTGGSNIKLVCSSVESDTLPNFQTASKYQMAMGLTVNGQICTRDPGAIKTLLLSQNVTRASLAALCPALVGEDNAVVFNFEIDTYGSYSQDVPLGSAIFLTVLWANNPEYSAVPSDVAQHCTDYYSPLVIRLPQDPVHPKMLDLSPARTIAFDLLGASDDHREVRIDWFTNLDYRMLTLPNANGQVLGIDQLFGNHTTGPDGKMASNGYAALAKYDGRSLDGASAVGQPDGVIDADDPIYAKLRVWLDANFDGIAQPGELMSLKDAGVTSIDLRYFNSKADEDQYGNMSLYKSSTQLSDGSRGLIFDLWFKVD